MTELVAQGHPKVEDLALKFGLLPFASIPTGQHPLVRPNVAQEIVGCGPTVSGQVALLQLFGELAQDPVYGASRQKDP
jgi:hypothetical protein